MSEYTIHLDYIELSEFEQIINDNLKLSLSKEATAAVLACRAYLDQKMQDSDKLIYGINTGFGSLCDTAISSNDLEALQRNLVLSHACGTGEEVPAEIVKRMLFLKVLGSLGASGDLAPLAHLCLPLLGEGEVDYQGKRYSGAEINAKFDLAPIVLQSKEGLALLNGTQFMSAYASYAVKESQELWNKWILVAGMSLDAYDGRLNPFQANVNAIRNQHGQIQLAEAMRELMSTSEIIAQEKKHVQDPYSFRCMPQVHGATKDTIDHCARIVEREMNAVTDNPTVFPETDEVVSAGNFHGQPLALIMDFLAIAMAEMGSISERRVYKLISGTRGLPAFLVANPGLNSGMMISQYTCASIVSQNKQLCTPASVDTIDSSNGQEDHVSMGANAATKLFRVIQNCQTILGIELMHAAQGLDFRRPLKSAHQIEKIHHAFRAEVPFLSEDRYLSIDMKAARNFVTKNWNEWKR